MEETLTVKMQSGDRTHLPPGVVVAIVPVLVLLILRRVIL